MQEMPTLYQEDPNTVYNSMIILTYSARYEQPHLDYDHSQVGSDISDLLLYQFTSLENLEEEIFVFSLQPWMVLLLHAHGTPLSFLDDGVY